MQFRWYQQTAWERGGSLQQDINVKFWKNLLRLLYFEFFGVWRYKKLYYLVINFYA